MRYWYIVDKLCKNCGYLVVGRDILLISLVFLFKKSGKLLIGYNAFYYKVFLYKII